MRKSMARCGCDLLLAGATYLHVVLVPFTKVEESFNLQAAHDICHHGLRIGAYDHLDFPGVVPRTFLGALAVALPACPIIKALELAGYQKLVGLYVVRLCLATYSIMGLLTLKHAIDKTLGLAVSDAFCVMACTQFHLLFYASRPLPNTFALPLISWAVADLMLHKIDRAICLLAFTSLVIRCDLLPFAAIVGLDLLLRHQISLLRAIGLGASAAASSLLSVVIDSFFWQRLLWPEGTVLWFNTAENRSSEWGTQPWHWYFSSALPRSMLSALPLAFFGLWTERRTRRWTALVIAYLCLYSILPHKELRFLLPVLPLLNVPPAAALVWLYRNRGKTVARSLLFLGAAGAMAISLALTAIFLVASRMNYPGGHALLKLHSLVEQGADGETSGYVHIGVLPAMTGVSRFGEKNSWQYSKEEDIPGNQLHTYGFTHLLSEEANVFGYTLVNSVRGYSHMHTINTLGDMLQVIFFKIWPVTFHQADKVFILQKDDSAG